MDIGSYILTNCIKAIIRCHIPVVQWLSSDINIFEPVFFLRVRIPEFFFSFLFSSSYSFSGQFELPSAVTNSGGSRRGSGGFGTDYFIFKGIFKKNERSFANRPPP